MKPLKSPYYEGRKPFTAESFANGRKLADEARNWMNANQRVYEAFFSHVKHYQSTGIRRRLRERTIADTLNDGIALGEGDPRLPNALWAAITRYMVMQDPSLKNNPVTFCQSDLDTFGLWPVEWMKAQNENQK